MLGARTSKQVQTASFAVELAGVRGELSSLDLHGTYPAEVEHLVDTFLVQYFEEENGVKIIFGRGEGKMRAVVLEYLLGKKTQKGGIVQEGHSLVADVIEKDGFCWVVFAK